MARINICGWETGDASEAFSALLVTAVEAVGRKGGYGLRCNHTAQRGWHTFKGIAANGTQTGLNTADLYGRIYLYVQSSPSANTSVIEYDLIGGASIAWLTLNTGLTVSLHYTNGSNVDTTIATSSALSTGQWYRLELKVLASSTSSGATVEGKIDGATIGTGTSLTLSSAPATIDAVSVGSSAVCNTDLRFDDFALDDAAYPGVGEVRILKPRATGTYGGWGFGTSTSYTAVAEVPNDGDTSYWGTSFTADIGDVLLDSSATAGVSGTIAAVKPCVIVRDEGGASAVQVHVRVTSPSTSDTNSTALDLSTSYQLLARLLTTNPAGGGAWDTAGVDSLDIGPRTNAAVTARCTAIYAMVECSGSTNYTQSVTGISGTITGTLVKQTLKSLSGISGTLSGILTRSTLKVLSGINGTLSGILNNNTLKALNGTISTLTGILTSIRVTFVSVVGTMGTLSGTLTNNTLKSLSGATGSLAASLVRVTQKVLSGVSGSLSGEIQKIIYLTLNGLSGLVSGSLAAAHIFVQLLSGAMGAISGVISRTTQKSLLGQINSIAGTLAKLVSKILSGTSGSMSGALSTALVKIVDLVGAVGTVSATLTRSTIKTVSGTLNQIVGSLSRGFLKNVSISGVLNSFSGDIGWYGIVKRAKMKAGEVVTTAVKAGSLATGTAMKAGSVLVTRLRSGWRDK